MTWRKSCESEADAFPGASRNFGIRYAGGSAADSDGAAAGVKVLERVGPFVCGLGQAELHGDYMIWCFCMKMLSACQPIGTTGSPGLPRGWKAIILVVAVGRASLTVRVFLPNGAPVMNQLPRSHSVLVIPRSLCMLVQRVVMTKSFLWQSRVVYSHGRFVMRCSHRSLPHLEV